MGLSPEQKKRFKTRYRSVDQNTIYWILIRLENVTIDRGMGGGGGAYILGGNNGCICCCLVTPGSSVNLYLGGGEGL